MASDSTHNPGVDDVFKKVQSLTKTEEEDGQSINEALERSQTLTEGSHDIPIELLSLSDRYYPPPSLAMTIHGTMTNIFTGSLIHYLQKSILRLLQPRSYRIYFRSSICLRRLMHQRIFQCSLLVSIARPLHHLRDRPAVRVLVKLVADRSRSLPRTSIRNLPKDLPQNSRC